MWLLSIHAYVPIYGSTVIKMKKIDSNIYGNVKM